MTDKLLKSRRLWVKLYVEECLTGSIRVDLKADERGVWYDLLLMAAKSRKPGLIQAGHDRPYPLQVLASLLNIPQPLLERTVNKCLLEGRIQQRPDGLYITNWHKYQETRQLEFPELTDSKEPGPFGPSPAADHEKVHRKLGLPT